MNINIDIEKLKEKQEIVSVILLGGAAILVVLTFIAITKYSLLSTKTKNIILSAIKQSERTDTDIKQVFTDTQNLAKSLITNNLFAPQIIEVTQVPQEEIIIPVNPVEEGDVTAILDNSAYINGTWYSVGDTIPGTGGSARIVAIKDDYVTIEFNNRTENFYPIDAKTQVSQITSTNPMSSMMDGISFNGDSISIDTSTVRDMMQRMFDRGGGMMGGFPGDMGGGMMGGRGGGRGGGGRGGFGGF